MEISPTTNKGGRPTNKDKPLGRADSTRIARKLGAVADEAIDLIIAAMRDEKESMSSRVKNAQWIVSTMSGTIKEVDRQTVMKYTLEKLKAEAGDAQEEDDDEPKGAVFSLGIVK